jgi:hypothetical protein
MKAARYLQQKAELANQLPKKQQTYQILAQEPTRHVNQNKKV